MWLFRGAEYDFIGRRKGAYVVSGVALLLGIGAMVFNLVWAGSWQNYGVDFTGGSLVQVRFDSTVVVSDVRAALGGVDAPPVTRFGEEHEFVIRAPLIDDVPIVEVAENVKRQLESAGLGAFEIVRTESVGPQIGKELERKAALAILFSFVLTLLYLAIRFEFRFGVAAVIATLHDILVTLGFLALVRVEISVTTVAAVLTIVGYSLNDTIVVFDRIRENLNKRGGRREDPAVVINRSINETLPRTILTSGTTIAVLLALLILGGAVIRDFTVVLILGVVIGTYSSIFVASPALLEIQKRWGAGGKTKDPRRKSSSVPV